MTKTLSKKEHMTLIKEHEIYKQTSELEVGEVLLLAEERAYDSHGRPFSRRRVRVGDESDGDVERREAFAEDAEWFEQFLLLHPELKGTSIVFHPETGENSVEISPDNLAGRWLYYDKEGNPTQMIDWAKDFPTAIALESLQRLERGGRMLPQGALDARTLELFTYMVDAIGIRSRARIYAQRLVELAKNVDGPMNIISVGSGAAVPNIDVTKRVEGELGQQIHWKFFDTDPRALAFAHELIEEAGFERSSVDYGEVVSNPHTNTLEFKGRSFVRAFAEAPESANVVDALGLWEYLDDHVAIKFLRKLYAKVKPGGIMIVSNMLKGRPQEQFNIRAVGWPSLYLRSEEDLLRIVVAAEIDTDAVTLTHSEDGVYVVMEIRKP